MALVHRGIKHIMLFLLNQRDASFRQSQLSLHPLQLPSHGQDLSSDFQANPRKPSALQCLHWIFWHPALCIPVHSSQIECKKANHHQVYKQEKNLTLRRKILLGPVIRENKLQEVQWYIWSPVVFLSMHLDKFLGQARSSMKNQKDSFTRTQSTQILHVKWTLQSVTQKVRSTIM